VHGAMEGSEGGVGRPRPPTTARFDWRTPLVSLTLAVVAPLKAVACGDSEAVVRVAAVGALGKIGSAPAMEALRCGLRDADKDVQEAAQEAVDRLRR
jgi:hypothetical protein